jgi:hypothetical protein
LKSVWTKSKIPEDERLRMKRELAEQTLNIWASWERSGDHTAAGEKALLARIEGVKNDFYGEMLSKTSLLKDINGGAQTQSREGQLDKAAIRFARIQSNSAVAARSRNNNLEYETPASMDDTTASTISIAEKFLSDELGFDESEIEFKNGKELYAKDKDGQRYRVRGTEGGEWYLDKWDTADTGRMGRTVHKWVPVAVRTEKSEKNKNWSAIDPATGKPKKRNEFQAREMEGDSYSFNKAQEIYIPPNRRTGKK